jgi:hypothetical protein
MIGSNRNGLYYLMHKDDIVTMVEIDPVSGQITRVGTKVRRELLPPGGSMSPDDLRAWWNRRAVPARQGMIRKILQRQGIPSPQAYLTTGGRGHRQTAQGWHRQYQYRPDVRIS